MVCASYFRCSASIDTAAIIGTAAMQISTTAEPANASSRKDPATSPIANSASAIASDANDAFAKALALSLLLLRRVRVPINAGTVK